MRFYPIRGQHGEYIGTCKGHSLHLITRIHVWGIRTLYPFLKKLLFRTFITASITMGIAGGMVLAENKLYPQVAPTYTAEAQGEVSEKGVPPILEKIAKCESGGNQFDKNGQVLINATKDMGKYGINVPIWGKKAHELGYNLAIESDNEAFAIYLFENYGSEPWVWSKKCWNK